MGRLQLLKRLVKTEIIENKEIIIKISNLIKMVGLNLSLILKMFFKML